MLKTNHNGISNGSALTITRSPAYAIPTPTTPPMSAIAMLSVRSWPTTCERRAPSAILTAISSWRPADRATPDVPGAVLFRKTGSDTEP